MIITIADYCKKRDVTRQFVYAYIKNGRFQALELPIFVFYENEYIEVGKQKFINVPKAFEPKESDIHIPPPPELEFDLTDLITAITDNSLLATWYKESLDDNNTNKEDKKKQFREKVEQLPEPQKTQILEALDEAGIKMMQRMVQMSKELRGYLKEIKQKRH